jgi:3'-phosphoadenosine 5'-phosphosulfate sulfotransferase (PAPS reductase)/FAD synthetase
VNQHFGSISGGKDSQAVLCRMRERADRRDWGNMPPRFQFCDTMNEDHITLEHIDYLERTATLPWFGQRIERLTGYDVPGLIDDEAFARKRGVIAVEWPKEKRSKKHLMGCNKKRGCDCPMHISPPVPDGLIAAAIEALQPTGVAFLDLAMIHGRFPGVKTRFCTEEVKLAPLMQTRRPLLEEGVNCISWVGERADESEARRKKTPIDRIRHQGGASEVLYRPVFHCSAADVFEISRAHGLKANPLYSLGMNRVGCFPCIMAKKAELREIAVRFPAAIDRIREWERITAIVSRRGAATFFAAKMVPGRKSDETRAAIDRAVDWAKTGKGGWNYDLEIYAEAVAAERDGAMCKSAYGLCE